MEKEIGRSWRWVGGDVDEWKKEKELKMKRNWRWG